MPEEKPKNQIIPFYFDENLPDSTAMSFRYFKADGLDVFVLASLYSAKVSNLDDNLNYALDSLESVFRQSGEDVLDRMKVSIFQSGDNLADYLTKQKLPLDDVDYSVGMVAFKGGVIYVWIDGNIGVRIHRGDESLIINSKDAPQFFGSTTVELGDIIEIAFASDIKSHGSDVESYVLGEKKPNYPGLFIDYQVENFDVQVIGESEEQQENEKTALYTADASSIVSETYEVVKKDNLSSEEKEKAVFGSHKGETNLVSFGAKKLKDKFSFNFIRFEGGFENFVNKVRDSDFISKASEFIKFVLRYVWASLMAVTSFLLDSIFGLVYSKNPYQFKRYQNSLKKKNLQYLLIFLIFGFTGYLILFRPISLESNNSSSLKFDTYVVDNTPQIKESLQGKFTLLQSFYANGDVNQFNSTFESLKSDIRSARDNGFTDAQFLNTLSNNAQSYYDNLFKITPITKVDEVFMIDDQNVDIVDFSVIGSEVYAINKAGGQVLKSNSITQKFEIFASDKDLTSLTHISCIKKNCYLTDENLGIVILNLETKTFSKFSALKDSAKGVKELDLFQVGDSVNVYTLVPDQARLVKYTHIGDGITPGVTWNKDPGFGPGTTDIAIDGGIFEINSNGSLRRFFTGNVDPVTTFAGLGTPLLPLSGDLQIATTPARNTAPGVINRFYIADSANKRIVVYEKDKDASKQYPFKGSYVFRGTDAISFDNIREIQLSNDEKSLFVLSNNIVFRFSVSAI